MRAECLVSLEINSRSFNAASSELPLFFVDVFSVDRRAQGSAAGNQGNDKRVVRTNLDKCSLYRHCCYIIFPGI